MIKIYKNRSILLSPINNMRGYNLNEKYYSIYCSKNNCFNLSFKGFSQCALHCEKSRYQDDNFKGVLRAFYKLIKEYVANYISEEKPSTPQGFLDYIKNFDNEDESVRDRIKRFTPVDYIAFQGISFPMWKNTDNFDYFSFLKLFRGIHFVDCKIYANDVIIGGCKVSFSNCIFKNYFNISNYKILSNFNIYVFEYCIFEDKLFGSPGDDYEVIDFKVFKDCDFSKKLEFNGLSFIEKVFNNEDSHCFNTDGIVIENCIFSEDFKINNIVTNKVKIKKSIFNKKMEIKNAEIKDFSFIDSNVNGIFDAYKSVFVKAKFYKSIFKDFAAFECVIFGDEKKENITDFIYTTFKDFSNFRNTKFKSGLNFSSANIKQEPNFLNTNINLVGTDRETLRIIKNSFEKVNNKIESNRFFIYEMMRYKKEVNSDVEESIDFLKFFFRVIFSGNEYVLNIMGSSQVFKNVMSAFSKKIVLSANYYISRFGESYIQPLMIFLFSIGIYTYILEVHKDIFSEKPIAQYVVSLRNFVTQDWFISISEFLNTCAANVPLFSKALEKKSGIEFISIMFFIWFGILTWQIIIAVKRNTQH